VTALGSVIAASVDERWVAVERDIFGTSAPDAIADQVDAFCRTHLEAAIARYEFYASSVGSVHGLQLADDRRVVVKAHRRDVGTDHLVAVQRVQASVAASGYPSPVPLLSPRPIARGAAIVETLLDRGHRADAREPKVLQAMATGLARLVEGTASISSSVGLEHWRSGVDRLWRDPHDRRFDFPGTAETAGWIDALAAEALRRFDALDDGSVIIGHGDWRVEHLRFEDGAISAVYDWDSLSVGPEAAFAGAAAHAFTANWNHPGLPARLPTLDESLSFLDAYQDARGGPFTDRQWRLAHAALVAALAYSARCSHSDRLTNYGLHRPDPDRAPAPLTGGFEELLATHGHQLLARCG
jgi:hypothetical protein